MGELGSCLLFYLRYSAEMARLYEASEPNVEGLPNTDETMRRVALVGDTASRQVSELLELCAPRVEDRCRRIATIERVRNNLGDSWELKYRVLPRRVKASRHFELGVAIDRTASAPRVWSLLPWIWCPGRRRAEQELRGILGTDKGLVVPPDWYAGAVALAHIPIPIPTRLDEPVPRAPLIDHVGAAFANLTARHITAIAAIANSRGEE